MKGRLIDFSLSLNRKQRVTVELDGDFREQFDELREADVDVEIKKHRKKRSLDANAYFWVLAGKLAAKTGLPTSEVYWNCIREIGDNFTIVPIREDAVHEWARVWAGHGAGWIIEDLGECRNIPRYHYVKSYYGSSIYDTRQMSRLLDLIIADCKDQGIETATPDELALMKARWEDAQHSTGR